MSALDSPPPLPVRVLPVEPVEPAPALPSPLPPAFPVRFAGPAADRGYHVISVVMMFLFCCGLPMVVFTVPHMWKSLGAGDGGFFSGHLILMIGRIVILVVALLLSIYNCLYALGGVAVTIAYGCMTRKISRAGFWMMGAFYGISAGVITLDAVNALNGPKVEPLEFPIPRMVGAVVVPIAGALIALVLHHLRGPGIASSALKSS